jgi:hypothetical protein
MPFAETAVDGDVDKDSLAIASSKGINVVRLDANVFPFRDGVFDLVTSFHTIEHLIITPNRRRLTSVANVLVRAFHASSTPFPMNPDHVRAVSMREIDQRFRFQAQSGLLDRFDTSLLFRYRPMHSLSMVHWRPSCWSLRSLGLGMNQLADQGKERVSATQWRGGFIS